MNAIGKVIHCFFLINMHSFTNKKRGIAARTGTEKEEGEKDNEFKLNDAELLKRLGVQ